MIQSRFLENSTMNSLGPRNWMYSGLLRSNINRTAQGKPLFERCRRESKWKPRKIRKFDFGSFFETRWGRFQLFLTEEWSSALERPCIWLSFPSLFGFWDPNLPSRRVNSTMNSLGPRNWIYSGLLRSNIFRGIRGKPLFEPWSRWTRWTKSELQKSAK